MRAGQAVIAEGMRRRAPVRTGRLRRSIESTEVKVFDDAVVGSVIDTAPYAAAVEYAANRRPYVRPTAMVDGPRAEAAMAKVLEKA